MKTLKPWRKWFWIIVWCWHIVRLMPSNFYEYFTHEICDSEDCAKIAKFWAKTTTMLTTFNDDPDLLKKNTTGDESWMHGYDIETKAQLSQWKAFCYDCGDKRKKSKQELLAISKSAFQKCFEVLKKRWHKCIISEGG